MADNPGNSNKFRASGREKFDLNLRSHGQICHGKQAHADLAEIDAKSIQVGRLGEYLHRGVQQLAFPASPVWFEGAFENHPFTGEDTVAQQSSRAKITDVQWNVRSVLYRVLLGRSPEAVNNPRDKTHQMSDGSARIIQLQTPTGNPRNKPTPPTLTALSHRARLSLTHPNCSQNVGIAGAPKDPALGGVVRWAQAKIRVYQDPDMRDEQAPLAIGRWYA
jgi:hypothetical protein